MVSSYMKHRGVTFSNDPHDPKRFIPHNGPKGDFNSWAKCISINNKKVGQLG